VVLRRGCVLWCWMCGAGPLGLGCYKLQCFSFLFNGAGAVNDGARGLHLLLGTTVLPDLCDPGVMCVITSGAAMRQCFL
jgi:hypothetical protein